MKQLVSSKRLRLSAHLGYLFEDLPLAARFAAARSAGFRAIEIPDPYSLSASEFRSLCDQNDLQVAQIAVPNGDSGGARKGLAALPGQEAQFEDALMVSIAFAKAVNCRLIHPMSGISAPFEPSPEWGVYVSNVEKACSAAARDGLCVIIEAISARGYFMNSLRQACAVIQQVNAPNLLLSLDTYHATAMRVHLPSFIFENCARIAHVQVADWPRRDEPGLGEIDFHALFAALSEGGYKGYVGLEYIPSLKGRGRFDWARRFDPHLELLRTLPDAPGPVTI